MMCSFSSSQVDKMFIDHGSKYTSGPYGPTVSEEEIGIISSKKEKFHAVTSFQGIIISLCLCVRVRACSSFKCRLTTITFRKSEKAILNGCNT